MKGGYYSSVFTHYYPVDWDAYTVKMNQHYRVPPMWADYEPREAAGVELLKGTESTVNEPGCEDEWCALKDTVSTYGPGPGYGKVMSAGGVVTELENIPSEESFDPDHIAPEEYSTPEPHPNSTPSPTPADKTCAEGSLVC